jgi:hypothetical protein
LLFLNVAEARLPGHCCTRARKTLLALFNQVAAKLVQLCAYVNIPAGDSGR